MTGQPAVESADDAPRAPPAIPGIVIEGELGRGGMGVVYRGRQTFLDRPVAVKLLIGGRASFAKRFEREARILAALSHPNIVACYQAGTTAEGDAYLVMEYIDGPTLRGWLEEHQRMGESLALAVIRDLAIGLDHAYRQGVIHRDVKLENVLLQKLPGEPRGKAHPFPFRPKLVDLGLARFQAGLREDMNVTRNGTILGTPSTMAPEQIDGVPDLDFRVDIYALGCVLYQLLVGKPPFDEPTLSALLVAKLEGRYKDPRAARPDLRQETSALVAEMLAVDRDQRTKSYERLIEQIDAIIELDQASAYGSGPETPSSMRLPAARLADEDRRAQGTSGELTRPVGGRAGGEVDDRAETRGLRRGQPQAAASASPAAPAAPPAPPTGGTGPLGSARGGSDGAAASAPPAPLAPAASTPAPASPAPLAPARHAQLAGLLVLAALAVGGGFYGLHRWRSSGAGGDPADGSRGAVAGEPGGGSAPAPGDPSTGSGAGSGSGSVTGSGSDPAAPAGRSPAIADPPEGWPRRSLFVGDLEARLQGWRPERMGTWAPPEDGGAGVVSLGTTMLTRPLEVSAPLRLSGRLRPRETRECGVWIDTDGGKAVALVVQTHTGRLVMLQVIDPSGGLGMLKRSFATVPEMLGRGPTETIEFAIVVDAGEAQLVANGREVGRRALPGVPRAITLYAISDPDPGKASPAHFVELDLATPEPR